MNTRFLTIVLLSVPAVLGAQDTAIKLNKPQNIFFYPQLNLQGGYDTAEPGDHWGLADRGARTQIAFELFKKAETRLQRGYTKLIEPVAWNVKLALELDPDEIGQEQVTPRLRLFDTWLELDTKWDRTSLWVGHKQIPYGHNPRLDPSHSFLPNQSGLDLSFGRDTGMFLRTPLSETLDAEVSLTAGKGDTWDYHGGWLLTGRVGTPTFRVDEFGVFGLAGKIQGTAGARTINRSLTELVRIGVDWVHKESERAKFVNQISLGANRGGTQDRRVLNILNSVEWFAQTGLTIGVTHALRFEDLEGPGGGTTTRGSLTGSVSFALGRDYRFRINPFVEYRDSTGSEDWGVLFQLCYGCGLTR